MRSHSMKHGGHGLGKMLAFFAVTGIAAAYLLWSRQNRQTERVTEAPDDITEDIVNRPDGGARPGVEVPGASPLPREPM